jgi:hypothetical protein
VEIVDIASACSRHSAFFAHQDPPRRDATDSALRLGLSSISLAALVCRIAAVIAVRAPIADPSFEVDPSIIRLG